MLSKAIMGVLPENAKYSGNILFNGKNLNHKIQTTEFALIPQTSTYLDPLMKVSKQIKLQNNELSRKSEGLYPFQCSGGMIRNALFSLLYEKNKSLIIADEPTAGLDIEAAIKNLEQLKNCAKLGKAVLLITHDLDLAINISDRIALFSDGAILEIVDKREFGNINKPYTKQLFDALPQNKFINIKTDIKTDIKIEKENINKKIDKKPSILSCSNIKFYYKPNKILFENLSFSIKQGEKICILGKSGSGKSTFAKILSGFEKPKSGDVLLNGKPIANNCYSQVQLIYQHPEKSVNPKWTIKQILEEGGVFDYDAFYKMGLDDSYLYRYPHELSGGQLQRVCILRALKEPTQFLICDEITTMLDSINQANIWSYILDVAKTRNIAILVITHNKALADKVCDTSGSLDHLVF